MKALCKFVDGHYEIALLWRQGCPDLLNNYDMALARLNSLGKRLKADLELHERYRDKIQDMVLKGHAIEVSKSSKCVDGRVWYIPHHCVTSKFRVVFDCAAQFCGTSLNNQILQGPDNTNNLVGVVTRFRKNAVAVVGDVRAMFMQVQVTPADQSSAIFVVDRWRSVQVFKRISVDSALLWLEQFPLGGWIRSAPHSRRQSPTGFCRSRPGGI